MNTRLVLASASTSRRDLLVNAGIDPVVRPSTVDEDAVITALPEGTPHEQVVLELAKAKAADVVQRHATDVAQRSGAERLIVVGCDSMLLVNDELVGKPLTPARAFARWQGLRGQSATLLTGHSVHDVIVEPDGDEPVARTTLTCHRTSQTIVHFGSPADADIRAYIDTGEPLNVAGAFTLEALGGWFIDGIEGDPSGVVGLSLPVLRDLLEQLHIPVSQLWREELTVVQPTASQ